MRKWQYVIIVKMKDGKRYPVWTYSKHFSNDMKLSRKGKKMFNDVRECYGMTHCNTAINWVVGLETAIKSGYAVSKNDVVYVDVGQFNPYYRRGDKEDVWLNCDDLDKIYFEMHLLNQGEQPE
jgi:hypothetical protein